jgi:hypothetical protein
MGDVYKVFKVNGYRLADFRDDWSRLDDNAKNQLRAGTLTY